MMPMFGNGLTPKDSGYYFPAEFAPHVATWLSWPHKEASWPGKINTIYPSYCRFIQELSLGEKVCINVNDEKMRSFARNWLIETGIDLDKIEFFFHPTNDAWCRDHGPSFLINPEAEIKKVIVDWNYNAWGGKYPPHDLDDIIPTLIGKQLDIPVFYPGIIMEGGSVEFNGKGDVITSTCCLLNKNRNPHLGQKQIEEYLIHYYGVGKVLWIDEGIDGDDTDGHIDDTVRFINENTVICSVEKNKNDINYYPLQKNLQKLNKFRLSDSSQLNIVELPMPPELIFEGQRLPASYANFYICNASVIVPTFQCDVDDDALQVLQECFPDRKIVGIDSLDIIWGLGSFHCLSQQEPRSLPPTPSGGGGL